MEQVFLYRNKKFCFTCMIIHHSRYIVDFRSAVQLPYDHRSVANTDTRSKPNILGRGCFISLDFSASVHVCVFVLLCANSLIFEKAGLLNNYVTPVLIN